MLRKLGLALFAMLLVACGDGGPLGSAGSRTDAFLEEAGFNGPLSIEVNPSSSAIFGYGQTVAAIQNSSNVQAIAFLTSNGVLSVGPMPEGAPYWRIQDGNGPVVRTQSYAFGQRRITGRTDARSWTESSVSYYGETITYVVDVSQQLTNVQTRELGPFTARIIIADDPRVGHWALQSLEYSRTDGRAADVRAALEIMTTQGQAARDEFLTKVQQAMSASFDAIAGQLAASGTVASDPRNENIRVSTANNLAILIVGPIGQSSIRELLERCSTLNVEGYSNWRIANYGDITRFVSNNRLIDVPDGRFWRRYYNTTFINPYVTGATSGDGGSFTSLAARTYGPNIAYFRFNDNGTISSSHAFGTSYGPHRYFSSAELYNARTDFLGQQLVCAATVG